MKRITALLLCVCLILGLTACSGQSDTPVSDTISEPITEILQPDAGNSDPAEQLSGDHNILIAYFTWADNTQVENPEAVDVDATTSASVLAPGNAAKIAGLIQQRTGGDLFSIVVEEPYSSDYDECLDRAADEKAEDARLRLVSHVENMEKYDVVFLGFPNWWYTVPMAIHSFIEEYDFSGKTVIPFVTHGTGGLASTIDDMTANLPETTRILEPIGVYRQEVDESQPAVNEWLDGLGFTETQDSADIDETTNGTSGVSTERTIRMLLEDQKILITLYNTPVANALYDMLPLELTFEDYNNIEKISYLPEEISTEGEPDGCDPDVGDFCLYAPWGNLSIFYKDFKESNGLISLGRIENGIETIGNMNDDFSVTLEAVE